MSLCLTKHTELMALQAAMLNSLSANGLAPPLANICQSRASFGRTVKDHGLVFFFLPCEETSTIRVPTRHGISGIKILKMIIPDQEIKGIL